MARLNIHVFRAYIVIGTVVNLNVRSLKTVQSYHAQCPDQRNDRKKQLYASWFCDTRVLTNATSVGRWIRKIVISQHRFRHVTDVFQLIHKGKENLMCFC